jgi:O-antigen/teichoic acid export membrane protein
VGPLGRLRRVRTLVPAGATGVGGGLVLLGASSYVFLTLSARELRPSDFAALSVLYTLVYTVGPGLFLPLEQELGRALAHRAARGEGGGPVTRRAAALSSALVLALLIAAAAAWTTMTDRLFDGSEALQAALIVALLTLWLAHLSRGGLAGLGRFDAYGRQLAVEGLSRAGVCVVLALAAVHAVGWYGWLLPLGLGLSVLATAGHTSAMLEPGPPAAWGELSQALFLLLAGSLLSQILVNAGPVVAKVLAGPAESAEAGRLLAGLVLTRVPLFLFAAVQAALLPSLAAALSRGDRATFLRGLTRVTAGLAGLGAASVVVALAVGPEVMRLLFGPGYALSRSSLTALAAASALYMLAAVFAQSLVALRRYGHAALSWGAGVAAFGALLAVSGSLVTRVSLSFLGGAAVAVTFALGLLALDWRAHGVASRDPDLLAIATVET